MKTLALAAALSLLPVQAPPPVRVTCPGEVCSVPAEQMREILELHNLHVDTINELRRELANADTKCRLERRV